MTIKIKQENGYRDLNYIQGTQGRQDKLQEGIQHFQTATMRKKTRWQIKLHKYIIHKLNLQKRKQMLSDNRQ